MTTNRLSLIIALSTIAVFAVLTMSMLSTARHTTPSTSYDQIERIRAQRYAAASSAGGYDQVELVRAQRYIEAAAQQAYLDYRHGEWTAGVNPAAAYLDYRRGEWTGK